MAFNDFYRDIPAPLAQEIDALALVVYRSRTAADSLLRAEGVADLDEWRKRLADGHDSEGHDGWERYLSAVFLRDQCERARSELAKKLRVAQGERVEGGESQPLVLDLIAHFLADEGESHGVAEWERLLDAVHCRMANGISLWIRFATPQAYSFVWEGSDGAMERIDTAPHREWLERPQRHTATGAVVGDPLTSPSAPPVENVRQVLRHLTGLER